MEEAERIALEEHGSGKIAVISGDWREEFMIRSLTFHTDTTVRVLCSKLVQADKLRTCVPIFGKFLRVVGSTWGSRSTWFLRAPGP